MDVSDLNRGVDVLFTGNTTTQGTRWGNMVYSPGNNCAQGYINYRVNLAPGYTDVTLESSSC